ncbi:hypothetical protein [Actinoplanes sp. N902-109]|uniref:hypothetical protein n=1 Tax=Actinoplanes sp. (strain N902-109) TaxID=649831 RepID=UPI00032961F7|nr:hypothetical protein [Actinoplanes sp. N902-109]AGL13671.1 hypothetical protein L083_0161 [Actinoplanes sp. N902-109]
MTNEWRVEGFDDALQRWSAEERPRPEIMAQVSAWAPELQHLDVRVRARLVDGESNVWVLWVPGCYLPDIEDGLQGVQCYFRVVEQEHRVVCEALHTTVDRSAQDVDFDDGMG